VNLLSSSSNSSRRWSKMELVAREQEQEQDQEGKEKIRAQWEQEKVMASLSLGPIIPLISQRQIHIRESRCRMMALWADISSTTSRLKKM